MSPEKGPFYKDMSSSNHHFSGDIPIFNRKYIFNQSGSIFQPAMLVYSSAFFSFHVDLFLGGKVPTRDSPAARLARPSGRGRYNIPISKAPPKVGGFQGKELPFPVFPFREPVFLSCLAFFLIFISSKLPPRVFCLFVGSMFFSG